VATLHDQTQGGGAMVVRDVKAPKKPYNAPSFDVIDINAAKEQLEAKTTPEDSSAQQMLSLIDKQLKEKQSKPNPTSINPVP
jgi:hypothetical protein